MRKQLFSLGVVWLLALCPTVASAQQTLEEATDSIKNVLALAKKGDAVAQNEVGGWYYRGRHVKQNYEEALQWWAKSAKQGNVQAIGNMGLCYQTGHGIAQDSLRAIQLYQRIGFCFNGRYDTKGERIMEYHVKKEAAPQASRTNL